MRKEFEVQLELGCERIEDISIPEKSRDELPPVLRALQFIFSTPSINKKVFKILNEKITSGVNKTGCYGMTLWEILVLSCIRLSLDIDYDRLHYCSNYDSLLRSLLGISHFSGSKKEYALQTLKDNVALLDEETIKEINKIVINESHKRFSIQELNVKIDSYVLETNVHFPTDLNLLWDATRKSLDLVSQLSQVLQLDGWRKQRDWKNRLKNDFRKASKSCKGAGKNTPKGQNAVLNYLSTAQDLNKKLIETLDKIKTIAELLECNINKYNQLIYFQEHIDKHIDLVRRRLIYKENIPHAEKVFSLFEPHTEWIKKGKVRNQVELGVRIAVATDQLGFILDHRVMENEQDVDIAVSFVQELLSKKLLKSVSFDKGFWSPDNYKSLNDSVENLIMPKKGKLNKTEKEREQSKSFKEFRRSHSAVEASINCLEHHGLNRCPDKGIENFKRYTATGVLAYNLHKLGNFLLSPPDIEFFKQCKN